MSMDDRVTRFWLPNALMSAGLGVFALVIVSHQNIGSWLSLRQLGLFSIAMTWGVSCIGMGFPIVLRLAPPMSLVSRLTLAFPLGVLVFALSVACLGFARALGTVSYFAVLTLGLSMAVKPAVRIGRMVSRLHRSTSPTPPSIKGLLIVAATLALALLYLPTLSPRHLSHDTLWYHLSIAEHYVAAGGIERLEEGWYLGLYPQLASWLYTWALLTPQLGLEGRSLLCMQLEFVVFVGTLATIPPLTRAVLGGAQNVRRRAHRWSWLVTFTFPSAFLYDLVAAADHMAAVFAAPAYLLLLRAWHKPSAGLSVLLGAFVSGGVLTKYSAAILFSPLAVVWGVRNVLGAIGAGDVVMVVRWRRSLVAFLATCFAVTSFHWLKNWIWYGSPFYPVLNAAFVPRPWHDHAEAVYRGWISGAVTAPQRGLNGYLSSVAEVFRFSFVSHDFAWLTKGRPMAGSLFTLTLLPLLLVTRSRRALGTALLLHAGLLLWAFTHAQDRFLQSILPVMVAVTAAALHVLWRIGLLARCLVSLLVLLQITWGSDVFAWPYRHSWYADVVSRGAAAIEGRSLLGDAYFAPWSDVGKKLPPHAKLLVHDAQLHYGTGARVVNDWSPTQGALDYGALGSPEAVRDKLTSLGVSHVVWYPRHASGGDSLAGDLYFHLMVARLPTVEEVGEVRLAPMTWLPPDSQAAAEPSEPRRVLYLGCGTSYRDGIYELSQLHVHPQATGGGYPTPRQPFVASKTPALKPPRDVSIVVTETSCYPNAAPLHGWSTLFKSPQATAWVRGSVK